MNTSISNRLKRISGQMQSLDASISNGAPCDETIPQFLAVKGAINAAFLAYVKDAMRECDKSDSETLELLLNHLVKS